MTRTLIAVILALSALQAAAGEKCRALDGYTLQCGRERVRVEGISAPELKAPGGVEARQRLQRRIEFGEVVIERRGKDKYGRTLGRVYVSGNRISQSDVSGKPR
jgi:endonuclease YncB( thermonuclease family)